MPPSSSFKAFSFESSNQSVQIMMRNYPKFLHTTIILESLYCPHSNYGAECSSVFIFLCDYFFFVLPFLHHLFFFACAKLLIKTGHETDRLKGFSSFERAWIIIVMLFFPLSPLFGRYDLTFGTRDEDEFQSATLQVTMKFARELMIFLRIHFDIICNL